MDSVAMSADDFVFGGEIKEFLQRGMPAARTTASALLALDLGTRTGWATNVVGDVIASGVVDFTSKRYEGGGMRYLRFQQWLNSLDKPRAIYFEEVRRHMSTDAAHVFGGLLATLSAWCELNHVPYCGIPVGTIKRHATGKGNAGKPMMIEAAMRLFPQYAGRVETDDEADALCLLHFAMEQDRKPIEAL
jgi:Holliday junction resolvasome RuvABC endonuclease subunit